MDDDLEGAFICPPSFGLGQEDGLKCQFRMVTWNDKVFDRRYELVVDGTAELTETFMCGQAFQVTPLDVSWSFPRNSQEWCLSKQPVSSRLSPLTEGRFELT
jgi:hypothetical protein